MKFRLLIIAFSLTIISLASCTSKEEKAKKAEADKKVRTKEDDKADSLLLVYDPEKSDKWIHNGTYAYGPWFLRLKTPWNGIAIHGTDVPESLGTKASEGCVRLHSDCITELKKIVEGQLKSKDKIYVDIIKNSTVLKNN